MIHFLLLVAVFVLYVMIMRLAERVSRLEIDLERSIALVVNRQDKLHRQHQESIAAIKIADIVNQSAPK